MDNWAAVWQQQVVTWGQSLQLAVHKGGGMNSAVGRIQLALHHIGSRATFSKLQAVQSPDDLDETDRYRAWLLLTAIGEDPASWGLGAVVLPEAVDHDRR